MKKDVWVLCNSREDMVESQRRINAGGGMRAFCVLSFEALKKALERTEQTGVLPSLLLADYESSCREDFASVLYLQKQTGFAGIPLYFMASNRTAEIDEICYDFGAAVILQKPLSDMSIVRIERAAFQQEMTRSYEKVVQKQAMELTAAKEIRRLNDQLSVRNKLLHQILGKYFSDEVVDVILEQPEGVAIGGEKKCVAVMMADLRGFTALSERLSAEEVVSILNHYLGEMTEVIMKYKGTIIEFIGDAILTVFGAPLSTEHAAADAVAAAIEMQNRMRGVNEYNRKNGYPDIEAGIGIHMGEVFVGNIGSEQFMRYNVIGQVVNLCSRIQTFSVGGQILVSKQVREELNEILDVKNSFEISMKGIHESLPIYDVQSITGKYNIVLAREEEEALRWLSAPVGAVLFLLQGKSVVKEALPGVIMAVSGRKIVMECATRQKEDYGLLQDVEIVVGEENAYAKIMKKDSNRLYLHFTFMSERFLQKFDCGESGGTN